MAQSGMRSYGGDAWHVRDRRARRQILGLQGRLQLNTRQVDKFGRPYNPIGRPKPQSGILWARLFQFHVDASTGLATGFEGVAIAAIGADNPDPMPGTTVYWPLKWPAILSPQSDMNSVLPGIPFGQTDGSSDVMVAQLPDSRPGATGPAWFIVNPHFTGVCL